MDLLPAWMVSIVSAQTGAVKKEYKRRVATSRLMAIFLHLSASSSRLTEQ